MPWGSPGPGPGPGPGSDPGPGQNAAPVSPRHGSRYAVQPGCGHCAAQLPLECSQLTCFLLFLQAPKKQAGKKGKGGKAPAVVDAVSLAEMSKEQVSASLAPWCLAEAPGMTGGSGIWGTADGVHFIADIRAGCVAPQRLLSFSWTEQAPHPALASAVLWHSALLPCPLIHFPSSHNPVLLC